MGKVGAPYGNKNAEYWTFKKAIQLFKDAIELSEEIEISYIKDNRGRAVEVQGYKYDFIGEVARELGTFHKIFVHLVKRFPTLQRLKSQLDNNLETNCYSNTKKGNIKEATGIVNMKSNWKWQDRQNIDHSNTDGSLRPDETQLAEKLAKALKIVND
jgi:hypothetical protein